MDLIYAPFTLLWIPYLLLYLLFTTVYGWLLIAVCVTAWALVRLHRVG